MKIAASKVHRALGVLMVVAALAYLVPFVPRGWIPHDEGMLGQSADRVLRGDIPHIDYEEGYTGGLTWLYAAVFRIGGVDLLNVRWLLFAAASWATALVYAILRRYLPPTGAGLATWVALAWSFPNYFVGIPSWWLLLCALASVWAMIRHVETGQWRYVFAAGLAVGLGIAIKQTGLYLLVALVLSLLYDGARSLGASSSFARIERAIRWSVAAAAILFAAIILLPRIFRAEGLYLFLPVLACAGVLFLTPSRDSDFARSALLRATIGTAAAALPLACFLVPYVVQDRLWDFVNGAVLLPRKRLAFASTPMPGALAIATGLPLMALVVTASRSPLVPRSILLKVLLWGLAILLPLSALRNVISYQLIWQSSRLLTALLPLWICRRLTSGSIQHPQQQRLLFMLAAMLAWASLNQFPFAAPVYFCYVAPIAVITGIAAASAEPSFRRQTLLPWAVMLLLFAVFSANRGYIDNLGVGHAPRRFETPLRLPRAHLKISEADVRVYRRLMASILLHLHNGQLIAGPDCPEVYFLAGRVNPAGTLFDFFSENPARGHDNDDIAAWMKGNVIVINHAPDFSPAPSDRLAANLRREFPHGEHIGPFEVRWR